MTDSPWQGEGPEYTIAVAGRRWTLNLDRPQPGPMASDGRSLARLLTLLHVSTAGQRDERAFDGSSLVNFERHRRRIQAVFAPSSWPGLNVRAAWEPTPAGDGLDLEVQLLSTSADAYPRVEVGVGSRWTETIDPSAPEPVYRVESRQAGVTGPFPPCVCRVPGFVTGRDYLEMVQPNDCARRVLGEPAPDATSGGFSIEHELFGHDLEKGVVLRGRIRGIWIDSNPAEDEVRRRYEAFRHEPPALGP